jgi:Flp pilus assembly protein TadD
MKLHENDEALKVLNEIIAKSPKYSRAWANRAVIYFSRGQMDQARADAITALQLDPTNGQAVNLLSMLNTRPAAVAAP